jgi:hypothetical protein
MYAEVKHFDAEMLSFIPLMHRSEPMMRNAIA